MRKAIFSRSRALMFSRFMMATTSSAGAVLRDVVPRFGVELGRLLDHVEGERRGGGHQRLRPWPRGPGRCANWPAFGK